MNNTLQITGDGFMLNLSPEDRAWIAEHEDQLRKDLGPLMVGVTLREHSLGSFPKEDLANAMIRIISRRQLTAA